jgi:hypothetical protein
MSIAEKFNIPPALFETIRKMNAEETEYQMKVKALMKKKGITSLGQLSPEEKKDFFNTLDAMHKAKHEEVELDEEVAGWIAMYNGQKLEIKKTEAKDLYSAKLKAIAHFKVPKSKQGLLAIKPAYNEEVELDEAIPKSTMHAVVHSSSKKIIAKGNKEEMSKKVKELNAKEKNSHFLGNSPSSKVGDKFGEEVEKKTQPPFTPDKPKKNPGVIPGKGGTGPSRAAHLAKMALRKQLKKEEIELDEAKKPVSKDDVTKLLIKYGNNPQSAKKMVDKEFASAVKSYPDASASKIAEVIRSVAEEIELDESKSSTGYDLYHKDFSSAMAHAYDFAKKKYNIEIDPLEIDRNVAMGPRKPASGKANAYRLLDKTGKKAIQVQVANLDNKRYELNMYKEDVQIDEVAASKALQKAHDDERKKRGLPDPSYYLKLAAQKKKEIEDMKKETQKEESGASKKKEDEFHTKLDKLVHKTFGHSSDEKKMKKEGVVTEMDKSQPSSSRGAEGLPIGKKADPVKTDKVKSDALKVLQKQYRKVKEEVELTESHFKVGQRVKCLKSGMSGTVTKVDPEGEGKYYTVKQDSGKVMKYAPDELKALKEGVEEAKNPQTSMKRAALSMDRAKEVVRHQKEIGTIRRKREALRNSFEPEESIEEKALWPGTPEYKKKHGTDKEKHELKYGKSDAKKLKPYGYRDNDSDKTKIVREAIDKMKKKKEATAKESKKDFKSGNKLSGKTEPIEINPELKEQKT